MGTYLSYTEYQNRGGIIPQNTFNVLEYKAELMLDRYTFNRLKNLDTIPEEVKACIVELINFIEEDTESSIKSESIGNYSYTKLSAKEKENVSYDVIKTYLSNVVVNKVPVLYIGVDE